MKLLKQIIDFFKKLFSKKPKKEVVNYDSDKEREKFREFMCEHSVPIDERYAKMAVLKPKYLGGKGYVKAPTK